MHYSCYHRCGGTAAPQEKWNNDCTCNDDETPHIMHAVHTTHLLWILVMVQCSMHTSIQVYHVQDDGLKFEYIYKMEDGKMRRCDGFTCMIV